MDKVTADNLPDGRSVVAEERRRRTTLADVAAQAGVSTVTASRALRRPDMVSADLRARVEQAAGELAYVRNHLASALASARTHTIGVVIPSLTNGVFADYLRALHDSLMPAGFQVLVSNSRYSATEEEAAIATILSQGPEAIIVAGIDQTPRARSLLERAAIPVIQTMELTDEPIDINIGVSHYDAGFAATHYLLGLGHRRIAHLSARQDPRSRRRMAGYVAAMAQAGFDDPGLVAATPRPSTVGLGAELLREVTARSGPIDALFCCNDDLALGGLFECQRRGIRVPQDVSIIGFNDLEFAASAFPSLSSVLIPRYEMGQRAAEIILDILRGAGRGPASQVDLGFAIKARESTSRRAD